MINPKPMEFFTVLFLLTCVSLYSATLLVTGCIAVSKFWVKNARRPAWLQGNGLYVYHFLDGLEYIMSRGAFASSMARELLVVRFFPNPAFQQKKEASPPKPAVGIENAEGSTRTRPRISPPK